MMLIKNGTLHYGTANDDRNSTRTVLFSMLSNLSEVDAPDQAAYQYYHWQAIGDAYGFGHPRMLTCVMENWQHSPLFRMTPIQRNDTIDQLSRNFGMGWQTRLTPTDKRLVKRENSRKQRS